MNGVALNDLREVPPLVGMVGKKRSGKDSFASTLTGERGFQRFAFADPMKAYALRVDPLIRVASSESSYYRTPVYDPTVRLSGLVEAIGWETAKEIREVRRYLQGVGSELRPIDEDFWVRATMEPALQARYTRGVPVVITDVRFPNEVEAVRAAGGTVVRVVRPGLESTDTHISETALDAIEADVTVYNAGTLEDLARQARSLAL